MFLAVPINFVSTLKKLKSLNVNNQMVAQALRSSSKLVSRLIWWHRSMHTFLNDWISPPIQILNLFLYIYRSWAVMGRRWNARIPSPRKKKRSCRYMYIHTYIWMMNDENVELIILWWKCAAANCDSWESPWWSLPSENRENVQCGWKVGMLFLFHNSVFSTFIHSYSYIWTMYVYMQY